MNGNNGLCCTSLSCSCCLLLLLLLLRTVVCFGTGRRKKILMPHHVVAAAAVIVVTKSTSCGDRKTSKLYKLSPKTTRQKVSQRQTKRLNVSKKDEKIDQCTKVPYGTKQHQHCGLLFNLSRNNEEKKKCEIFISDPKIGFRLEVKFQFHTTQHNTAQRKI